MDPRTQAHTERVRLARLHHAVQSHKTAMAFLAGPRSAWRLNRAWRMTTDVGLDSPHLRLGQQDMLRDLLQRGGQVVCRSERPTLLCAPARTAGAARAPMRWHLRFWPVRHGQRIMGVICRLQLRVGWRGALGRPAVMPWYLPAPAAASVGPPANGRQHCRHLAPLVHQAVHPLDRSSFLLALEQAHQKCGPFAIDCRIRLRAGQYHWHRIVGRPERSPDGRLVGWLGGSQDRQEHNDTCRMRRAFLRLASHELNTPLTSLTLNLQLALSRAQSSARAAQSEGAPMTPLLSRALEQARKLGQTVDTLLDVQSLMAGKLPLVRQRVDVATLLAQALEAAQPMLLQVGCRVSCDISEEMMGEVDASRLNEVFFHLLSNATKFAPGSHVNVVGRKDKHGIHITVHDDGPGIPKHASKQIFDLFGRGKSHRSTSGLGIGLYLCRRIVRAHGGRLSLDEHAQRGAHFVLSLPLQAPGPSLAASGRVAADIDEKRDQHGATDKVNHSWRR